MFRQAGRGPFDRHSQICLRHHIQRIIWKILKLARWPCDYANPRAWPADSRCTVPAVAVASAIPSGALFALMSNGSEWLQPMLSKDELPYLEIEFEDL